MKARELIEEFLLTLSVPAGIEDSEIVAMRRLLNRKSFRTDLERAFRAKLRRHKILRKITVKLSR